MNIFQIFLILRAASAYSPSAVFHTSSARTSSVLSAQRIAGESVQSEDAILSNTPLSMSFDDLIESFGSKTGRSRAVWDCYRMGIDPILFYDPSVPESELDMSITNNLEAVIHEWTREELRNLITPKRRKQGLGAAALKTLSNISATDNNNQLMEDQISTGRRIEESVATISHISRAKDGTTKLLVELLQDGLEVEMVVIPWHETKRSTLCISSQVGCRQGCSFCATGRMGRLRNLSADEILAQVFLSRKVCRTLDIYPVDGVVFMGMGDAADNTENVIRAAEVLTHGDQFKMAQRKVTISTVGPDPESFYALGKAPTALAWSVHATEDSLRKKLVPTTKHTMKELQQAYMQAMLDRPVKLRTTMLEIALIENVNDSKEDADHLASFVQNMYDEVPEIKVMVNLIPFNDIGHPVYRKPSVERVWEFQERLTSRGFKCFIRTTRGDDESAACGQLATKRKKVTS